jgi:hypothetical protein
MTALPHWWVTMMPREGTASGRTRTRQETNSPERQRYRQSPPAEKESNVLSISELLRGYRPSPEASIMDIQRAVNESVEADSLPRILGAIDDLMAPNENDGETPATEHAYQSARAVVESAYGLLLAGKGPKPNLLPAPIVTTDERGGVKLSWQRGDRHVRTNFAAADAFRSYLYFESPTEHDVQALQPAVLSSRLDWLLKA